MTALLGKPTMIKTTRKIFACIILLCALALAAQGQSRLTLPTPRDHYKTYDVQRAELELIGKVIKDFEPQILKLVEFLDSRIKTENLPPTESKELPKPVGDAELESMAKVLNGFAPEIKKRVADFLRSGAEVGDFPQLKPEDVVQLARAAGFVKYKADILEILLHSSDVLAVVPKESFDTYGPIIHDALLAFLDGLPDERILDRALALAMAHDASRGEKILVFASKIPTLQKVGQIIARVEGIPPDIQQSLQTLETGIRTMTREELVAYIEKDVGGEVLRKYDVQFDDRILAEASVGAVIHGSFQPSGEPKRQDFVCKVVKPYVQSGLPEEMRSIGRLITLVTEFGDFYNIEGFDLKDFFADVRDQLEREIKVSQEQGHFRTASEFYKDHKGIKVPEIFAFSTEHVTFMEFLNAQKLTDSFVGDKASRHILAERLVTVMTFDALFSKQDTSIFHGDPHAGNIMRIKDDPQDPYKLALLDWGLMGEFPRQQRMQMVQLNLAYGKKNKKRMVQNIGSLIQGGLPKDPQKMAKIEEIVGQAMKIKGGSYEVYNALLGELFKAGYVLDTQFSLFIKSQVTIAGILRELDSTLNQDKLVKEKVRGLVMKEFPKRLVLLPAWNYRGYRSTLSNGDVFRQIF
jgi:ubiquinone biosynthesis protein